MSSTIVSSALKTCPTDPKSLAFIREIKFCILERYLYMINHSWATMIVQITLTFPPSGICSPNNDHIVQLLNSISTDLNRLRLYHQYVWIPGNNQVYLCLLVDTIEAADFPMIVAKVNECWENVLGIDSAEGLVYSGKHDLFLKNGIILNSRASDNDKDREGCYCWITSLATRKYNGNAPANIRGFGASRVPSFRGVCNSAYLSFYADGSEPEPIRMPGASLKAGSVSV